MPLHPLHEPLTYAGYLHHPSTYLHCTGDQSLVLPRQELAVNLAREAGANMNTITCDASEQAFCHAFFFMPADVEYASRSLVVS
jgi:hypothetical protein